VPCVWIRYRSDRRGDEVYSPKEVEIELIYHIYYLKMNFRESFPFSIVTIQKISPPCKPEIQLFRHFPKLKISYFNGKILSVSLKLNFTPITLGLF